MLINSDSIMTVVQISLDCLRLQILLHVPGNCIVLTSVNGKDFSL